VPLDDDYAVPVMVLYDGKPVRTITDKITEEVMQCRKAAKKLMKSTKDVFLKASYDALQLSYKVVQNSLYGYLGAETSDLCCTALSVWTTQTGQYLNKLARYTAIVYFGARCVYGDTDSIMLQWPLPVNLTERDAVLSAIHAKAVAFGEYITARSRSPQVDEFESLKTPSYFTDSKKLYAAIEYNDKHGAWRNPNNGHLLAKGFAFKKRDRCASVTIMGKQLLSSLLAGSDDDALHAMFTRHINGIMLKPRNTADIQASMLSVQLNAVYKNEAVLALDLARQIETDTGTRPMTGRRLKYVVQQHDDERKQFQCSRPINSFLNDPQATLDAAYMIQKQHLLPCKQIFNLRPSLYKRCERTAARVVSAINRDRCGQQTIFQ